MSLVAHRRALTLAAGLAVGSLVLAACGGSGSASDDASAGAAGGAGDAEETAEDDEADEAAAEPVEISYFTFSAAPDHLEDLDTIVADFEAANPDVTVSVETAAYDDYFTSLQTAIAGGVAPDTFELNYENFVTYAESGSLLELPADSYDPAVYAGDSLAAFTSDGTQYGLPASFSTVVLFYNKDLFEAAGVDLPTDEWTWEDEDAAAEALTDLDAGVYGNFQPVQFFEFYKTLQQAGGEFFDADGAPAFNGPEGVRAAEWLVGKAGRTMPTTAEIGDTPDFDTNLFKEGRLAMWHNGIWQFSGLQDVDFEWDVVVEPGAEQKASAVFQNAAAVSATTENPDAAARWVAHLTGSTVTAETRIASSWELPPVSDEAVLAAYLEQPVPANRQAVFDSLEAIALPPVISRQQEMQDVVTEQLTEAAAGRKSVQQALDDAAAAVAGLTG
jgi:multiple sugar transport system substrate-binding protein